MIMYYTPRINRKNTQTTHYSSNLSTLTKKHAQSKKQSFNSTTLNHTFSSKNIEKEKPIAYLPINVNKHKVSDSTNKRNDSPIRINHFKHRANVISKMSSHQHGSIIAYGISTYKGYNNMTSPHFLSVNLGQVKNVMLVQAFDGTTAAKIIRERFPLELIELSVGMESEDQQKMIEQAFKRIQDRITKKQVEEKDNSGACFISIVIKDDLIMVANAGASQAICRTKNGSLLKLSNIHTTKNDKQMKRIINNGGTVYQTVVNIPYQEQLQIRGPMRVSPYGLIYTRCLGRALDHKQMAQKQNKSLNQQQDQSQLSNLTWIPEIKYIKTNEVVWMGIFSEAIVNNCSTEYINECVKSQMAKKSESYTEHHISMQISNKIVTEMTKRGIPDALSAIILFLSPIDYDDQIKITKTNREFKLKLSSRSSQKQTNPETGSLTYLGNRKSFVKQIDPNCRNYSLKKRQKSQQKQRQLKKQFSFNNFN